MDRQRLADEIKTLRDQRSWSQALLAEHAGLSLRTVQRLEKEGACSQETLLAIASAFDIDVRKLTRLFTQESVVLMEEYEHRPRWIEFSLPNALSRLAGKMTTMNKRFYKSMASWGLVLLVIPLTFISVGVFKYSLGFENMFNPFDALKSIPLLYNILTSPVFLLGSLATAIALNVLPLIDFRVKKEEDRLTGSFALMGNRWNAIIVGASLFFMTSMMGYALIENVSEQSSGQVQTAEVSDENMTRYVLIEGMNISLSQFPIGFSRGAAVYSDIIGTHKYAQSVRSRDGNIRSIPTGADRSLLVRGLNDDKQAYEMLGSYEELITANHTKDLIAAGYLKIDEGLLKKNYSELRQKLAEVIDEQEDFLEKYEASDIKNLDEEDLEEAIEDMQFIRRLKEENQLLMDFLVTQSKLQQDALQAYLSTVN